MKQERSTRPFARLLLLALVAWGGASLRAGAGRVAVAGGGPQTGTGTTDLIRSRLPPPPPPPPSTGTTGATDSAESPQTTSSS